MFFVRFTNFHYYSALTFKTLDAAIEYAKRMGFEFEVYRESDLVAYASGVSLSVTRLCKL